MEAADPAAATTAPKTRIVLLDADGSPQLRLQSSPNRLLWEVFQWARSHHDPWRDAEDLAFHHGDRQIPMDLAIEDLESVYGIPVGTPLQLTLRLPSPHPSPSPSPVAEAEALPAPPRSLPITLRYPARLRRWKLSPLELVVEPTRRRTSPPDQNSIPSSPEVIEVDLRLPGCLVVPPRTRLRVTDSGAQAHLWITPVTRTGRTSGNLLIGSTDFLPINLPLSLRILSSRPTRMAICGALFSLLFGILWKIEPSLLPIHTSPSLSSLASFIDSVGGRYEFCLCLAAGLTLAAFFLSIYECIPRTRTAHLLLQEREDT